MLVKLRYWHFADVPLALTNVCFEGKNGHDAGVISFPLMTQSEPSVSTERAMPVVWFECTRRGNRICSIPGRVPRSINGSDCGRAMVCEYYADRPFASWEPVSFLAV